MDDVIRNIVPSLVAKFQAKWKQEMGEGRGTIAGVVKLMQAWLPLLKRDIPGFDAGNYGDKPEVPDDVIEDGERLMSVIDEFRNNSGNPLAYQKAVLDALGPAVQAAIKEWGEAEAADAEYQQSFATVREMAAALQQDLVALRRSLLATAGRGDKDYTWPAMGSVPRRAVKDMGRSGPASHGMR